MVIVFDSFVSLAIYLARDSIGRLFSNDKEVLAYFPQALTCLSIFLVFDTIQLCGTGVLKSMGRQEYASRLELYCEVFVGLSVAYLLGI